MKTDEYTIKERYCPEKKHNIVVRIEATAEAKETCISGDCGGTSGSNCPLNLKK